MPFLDWKPEYSVGDGDMDAQHKTKQHFHDEEKFMVRRYFPGLVAHKLLHAKLLALAEKLVSAYSVKPTEKSATAIADFLKKWLVNHILEEDMKYAPYRVH